MGVDVDIFNSLLISMSTPLFLVACFCVFVVIFIITLAYTGPPPPRSPVIESYQDVSGSAATLKELLVSTYGEGILWTQEYNDIYELQSTYLTTLQNMDQAVDPRTELERASGGMSIVCRPAEVERLLAGEPSLKAAQQYVQCLPQIDDLFRLTEFLVNEIKMRSADADKALSGDVSLISPAAGPVVEQFQCVCVSSTDIQSVGPDAERRTMSDEKRGAIRALIRGGLDAKKRADEISNSAKQGTLAVTPPVLP